MSATVREISLPLADFRLAARVWGEESGLKVLALHGWLDNASSFDPLAPHLKGVHLVALDMPGHGWSEHRHHGPYHFVDMVADALNAADELGWDRFVLLGHSMGGAVATLMAGAMPERVRACVLLEGLGPLTMSDEEAPQRLGNTLNREKLGTRRPKKGYPTSEAAAERYAEATGMNLAAARIIVARGLEAQGGQFMWRSDPKLRLPSRHRFSEGQVHAYLRAIKCPVLLSRSTQGYPYDANLMQARVDCVQRIALFTAEGSHHAHMERPELFAQKIQPFLDSLDEA